MRLALKWVAVLTAWIALVLVAQAALHVERVASLQEREIRDDAQILGRALAAGTAELWLTAGPERARHFVETADQRRQRTEIRLRETDVPSAPTIERLSRDGSWYVVAIHPVRAGATVFGAIEIKRQLMGEREYFDSILLTQILVTLVAVVVSAALAWQLGNRLIGRPISELVSLAHRVADGDFSLRAAVHQRDEVGHLARELNAMTERLAASDTRVRQERRARTAALEQLRHADRLSTVGKLASSMAHELGTPLNVVSGRAAMIQSDEAATAEIGEHAVIIAQQAQRMTHIIRELLDFSRRKPMDRQDAHIADVLERAALLMEPVCDDKGIQLHVESPPEATAQIDENKTMQVLTNLIMNAIHAMPEGGAIHLTAEHQHVEEPPDRHAATGDYVKISVRDEGVGIAAERLEHIFQAFFTTKKSGKGTGLGLSVCHGIVREHGGFITVESELGQGSCFSVYLPEKEME